MTAILGFEFLIRENGAHRWVRLQGSGGMLGNGHLHLFGGETDMTDMLLTVQVELLGCARAMLKRTGELTEVRPGTDRDDMSTIRPDSVLDVRPIYALTRAELLDEDEPRREPDGDERPCCFTSPDSAHRMSCAQGRNDQLRLPLTEGT